MDVFACHPGLVTTPLYDRTSAGERASGREGQGWMEESVTWDVVHGAMGWQAYAPLSSCTLVINRASFRPTGCREARLLAVQRRRSTVWAERQPRRRQPHLCCRCPRAGRCASSVGQVGPSGLCLLCSVVLQLLLPCKHPLFCRQLGASLPPAMQLPFRFASLNDMPAEACSPHLCLTSLAGKGGGYYGPPYVGPLSANILNTSPLTPLNPRAHSADSCR